MFRLLAAVVLLLTACDGAAPERAQANAAPSATPTAAASATTKARAAATAGGTSAVAESTELYEFEFRYPTEAGRIPALRAWFDARREAARRELVANAREGRANAAEMAFDFHPYAKSEVWETVTETPRFLSLSASVYEFSGGAHPNHWADGLVWDKRAGMRREPIELFASKAAFDSAVGDPFCAALDRQRAERRGEPVNRAGGGMFDQCIAPSEQTVILGSRTGEAFDRIGVLVAPYNAGPYAEGSYEVTLPVTAALLRAVRAEYRSAFAAR